MTVNEIPSNRAHESQTKLCIWPGLVSGYSYRAVRSVNALFSESPSVKFTRAALLHITRGAKTCHFRTVGRLVRKKIPKILDWHDGVPLQKSYLMNL